LVHQNVQRGQTGNAGLHRREIGDVERNGLCGAACRYDRVARRLDLTLCASRQDDFSPGLGKTGGGRKAEASACAGDKRALPVQTEGWRAGNLRHSAAWP
jgi:hypothetical protein